MLISGLCRVTLLIAKEPIRRASNNLEVVHDEKDQVMFLLCEGLQQVV